MMRGVSNWAVAVRKPTRRAAARGRALARARPRSGEIEVSTFPLDSALRRHRVLRLPIIRGVVALGGSLAIGFRALEISANAQLPRRARRRDGEAERGDPARRCGRARSSSRSRSRSSCSS